MIDVRTARCGAARSGGIARIVQVAGSREVDLDGAVAMEEGIAGTRHLAFAMVASEAVTVSVHGFLDVAGTREIDFDSAVAVDVNIAGSCHCAFALVAGEAVSIAVDGLLDVAGT